mmetsp:Transcript_1737/g.3805  ORF Transcript_1737/g.3805 Transcript_1737/m.3805 type:complete len:334 (+) Transcript_1737:123-1124(+)|eukprot:CAMPEP_0172548202 /NCGR_PEP_ID=MMETSP1067-20121228/17556_1 /TAXON_ID=265564 ORGANISM="Thalassiosira punctigera, Strain Tpunct2005C2" /NCGR_SAMPLE_ID=MMETSP1067 /ASSEMBLY_ACC=CAM_ASM_000444 /LENGTH=333 /DNA_ID=CAMNT_0013335395 /DNA_START=123 /DNA_END=1124 /DNA_ORIENTATION=-
MMSLLLTAALLVTRGVHGFIPSARSTTSAGSRSTSSPLDAHRQRHNGDDGDARSDVSRHRFLATAASAVLPVLTASTSLPAPTSALVKGNAPPPKKKPSDGSGGDGAVKCRNVEECQEMAEKAEALRARQEAERAAAGPKPQVADGGTKYLDIVEEGTSSSSEGDGTGGNARVARAGDAVDVHYKVLKLGKRSYDGLTGEGTVVFSRGYALEDDEKVPGDRSFKFTLGDARVIKALNDAVPGMAVGGTRRISVTPQNGWEKDTRACDGGPGGSGTGGELKTDYVVVPTATMVEQEACFDKTKLPFPATYAQERRMAQRFDQSLIVEVRLVNVL